MVLWAKFWTLNGVEVTYGADAQVQTLDGAPKRAGDCSADETVLVEVWDPRAKRSVRHQAIRDAHSWKAELARRDGSGLAEKVDGRQVQPQPTDLRKARPRGWVKIRAAGASVAIEFAPFVAPHVVRHHRASSFAFAELELGTGVVAQGSWMCVPPAQLERAVQVVVDYLAEHGFSVERIRP